MNFEKPYYIVTFISQLKPDSIDYDEMAEKMLELSGDQDGFLGIDSVRAADGKGITVCYWQDLKSIKKWKNNVEHAKAQELGVSKWYESFSVTVSKVE